MRAVDSRSLRFAAASVALLLALATSACDGDASTPTAPLAPAPPPTLPPSPLPASEPATPGTYERTDPVIEPISGETYSMWFVIEANGRLQLIYDGGLGRATYPGRYAREGDLYAFLLDDPNPAAPVEANASFLGKCLEVRWRTVGAVLSDFLDGTFCR